MLLWKVVLNWEIMKNIIFKSNPFEDKKIRQCKTKAKFKDQ